MRVQGLFVGSRVGLRVFALFLLAATVPVAVLGLLTQHTVGRAARDAQVQVLATAAKSSAMVTLDRLRLAQLQLQGLAAGADAGVATPASALLATLRLAPSDPVQIDWARVGLSRADLMQLAAGLPDGAGRDRLAVVTPAGGPSPPRIVLLHRAARDDALWFGIVDPEYLWDGAGDLPPGQWACAFDGAGLTLFCSDDEAEAEAATLAGRAPAQADDDAPPHAVKPLFLAGTFDARDWSFVSGSDTLDATARPFGPGLVQTAVAGLLIAALASMVQIRRTLVPLGRLADGARRIGERRFDTRVDVPAGDEFSELADAMNQMAQHLQGRFDELAGLAAIDQAILSEAGIDPVLGHILHQLATLLPQRPLVIGRATFDEAGRTAFEDTSRFHCHLLDEGADAPRPLNVSMTPEEAAELRQASAGAQVGGRGPMREWARWLADTGATQALVVPMLWRGELKGFVALGSRTPITLDPDDQRRLHELRDRAAVAVTTAQREHRLVYRARHDSLTGLLNRHGLISQLDERVQRAARRGERFSLLFIDLDRFKTVNDAQGHQAGDQALRVAAERVLACVDPARDLVARPAGDEFVVLLDEADGAERALEVAALLCERLRAPLSLRGSVFVLGASVGISTYPEHGAASDELLRHADIAMYESKRAGTGRVTVFEGRFDAEAQRRSWIERDLRFAVGRGELVLAYQPRVDVASGRVNSVEALIRWQHPLHGLCMPGSFVPIAEESDLIVEIGDWVIDAACAQARAWADAGRPDLRVAVNVSARQLRSGRLVSGVRQAIARHGIAARSLEIEITEGMFIDNDPSIIDTLMRIRAMDVQIALDDFGTGYSSMSYLRRLPIDIMKIDRAFVADLDAEDSALAVVRAIVTLATTLGKRLVAEGVETEAQAEQLRQLGCHELQGYLLGRPATPQALAGALGTVPALA